MKSEIASNVHAPDAWGRIHLSDNPFNPARNGKVSRYLNRRKFSSRISGKLLDIGSVVDQPLVSFRRATGCEVYRIKSPSLTAEVAKRKSPENGLEHTELNVGMVPPIGYPDRFFDAVLHSIWLRQDSLAFLLKIGSEICRVLKPQGIFFFSAIAEKPMRSLRGTVVNENGFESAELDAIRNFIAQARMLGVFHGFELRRWQVSSRQGFAERRIVTGIFNLEQKAEEKQPHPVYSKGTGDIEYCDFLENPGRPSIL